MTRRVAEGTRDLIADGHGSRRAAEPLRQPQSNCSCSGASRREQTGDEISRRAGVPGPRAGKERAGCDCYTETERCYERSETEQTKSHHAPRIGSLSTESGSELHTASGSAGLQACHSAARAALEGC